jgi:hypothetical protein
MLLVLLTNAVKKDVAVAAATASATERCTDSSGQPQTARLQAQPLSHSSAEHKAEALLHCCLLHHKTPCVLSCSPLFVIRH